MSKILIVDDERSIRRTFEIFLSKEGYSVFLAEDVPNALDIIEKNDIDLIFTDVIMPRITGIEMLNILKEKNPEIPVIIMTGEPTVETAKMAVRDRAHDYLIKPVSKQSLLKSAKLALIQKKLSDDKAILEKENNEYRENLEILVEKRTRALQGAVNGTISTIAKILESKDPYTAGHEMKVANLSYKIAEKMNLTKDQKDRIYFAGYLHDIGKLLVPAEILSKPGRLTDSEYTLIKDHVIRGYELLRDIQLPWAIADVILQHHERIDGSGYPNGLKGDEQMIEAKIIAVADVVEAMASHRPYRPGFSIKIALDEIKARSGDLYDEEVTKIIVELFEQENYEFDSDYNTVNIEIKASK